MTGYKNDFSYFLGIRSDLVCNHNESDRASHGCTKVQQFGSVPQSNIAYVAFENYISYLPLFSCESNQLCKR